MITFKFMVILKIDSAPLIYAVKGNYLSIFKLLFDSPYSGGIFRRRFCYGNLKQIAFDFRAQGFNHGFDAGFDSAGKHEIFICKDVNA